MHYPRNNSNYLELIKYKLQETNSVNIGRYDATFYMISGENLLTYNSFVGACMMFCKRKKICPFYYISDIFYNLYSHTKSNAVHCFAEEKKLRAQFIKDCDLRSLTIFKMLANYTH